jgi:hypothetical protein
MVVVDTHRIPKDLREVVRDAERDFNWFVVSRKKNGYLLSSPGKTQTFYVPFSTHNPHLEAKRLRMAMAKAALTEGGPIQEAAEKAMSKGGAHMQVECHCGLTFLTMEAFDKHACTGGVDAPVAGAATVMATIPLGVVSVPSERHTEVAAGDSEPVRGSFGSGSMSNKEEDVVVKGEKRGSYRKSAKVEPGIARAIYEAMRDRPQYKNEAHSAYANRIGGLVEAALPKQPEPVTAGDVAPPAPAAVGAALAAELSEAREKLAKITEVLGIDVSVIAEAQELREKNARLKENVTALKGLFEGIEDL